MFKNHPNLKRVSSSALFSALFVLLGLLTVACSSATRSLFFDIPEKPPETEQPVAEISEEAKPTTGATSELPVTTTQSVHPADIEADRPPIEEASTWEEALELLPKDAKGQPDWDAALREEVIKPRALDSADRQGSAFKLDFYLKADKPKFDAYFPHSSHLQWMGCESCHPAVFRYRDNEMSMKSIRNGEHCGACHDTVAFPAKTCKRCHTSM